MEERQIYCDNQVCWYALAGEIIKSAATETYQLRKKKAEIEAENKILSKRILENTEPEWREEVSPLLLGIKISNQQLDIELKRLEGHTDCDGIRIFRTKLGENDRVKAKLKECTSFFKSNYYKIISVGLDADLILKRTAEIIKEEEMWKYISKVEGEEKEMYKITPTPKQKAVLRAAGYTNNLLFDSFSSAAEFRDAMVEFCQEQYRKADK